ncbi:MAG: hypothetical protein Q8Q08_01070 [Candidatus Omnitrophota bacterium]|nr:hypothetical protein [Candidatus Omnitrophota bacterium]MDZ4241265.1 hypothetical protein [Candidatus Omnitrophota bacterium]
MLDPFRLFGRMVGAGLKSSAYLFIFLGQVAWYLAHTRTDKIGDAYGDCAREIVKAISEVFEER